MTNRWAYHVVCALVRPGSDAEWQVLQRAAFDEYHDAWADAGAIQTLKLIASDRSRGILEEAMSRNPERDALIAKALEYIDSHSRPLRDTNLERLAARAAQALEIGDWDGNSELLYNRAHDKAIVDCVFERGRDRLTYTATFYRERAVWQLTGVRETMQALMPPAAPPVVRQP